MGEDRLGVLTTTHYVVEHGRFVTIEHAQVEALAERLAHDLPAAPEWDAQRHFVDGTARTANYVLVLDALNFCFWGEPRWRIEYRGERLDGYWALAAALKRAIEEGVPLLDAAFLARLTTQELGRILRGDEGVIPLLDERTANLREVGAVLLDRYEGQFANMVEAAGHSAIALVQCLVAKLESFDDVARYGGREVKLYKRAQICVADLHGSFGGQAWGHFDDLNQLTAFADYKVPQILRCLGILSYEPALAGRIDAQGELPAGSLEEVAIRAAAIWAVEYLRRALARRGRDLRAFELDWYLWNLSQNAIAEMRPYHRTRTIFY